MGPKAQIPKSVKRGTGFHGPCVPSKIVSSDFSAASVATRSSQRGLQGFVQGYDGEQASLEARVYHV